MRKDYRGIKRRRFKGLLFCNEMSNPIGYVRSAGISQPRVRREPDTHELWSVSHYNLVMLLENSTATYRNELGYECPLEYGDFLFVFPGFKQRYGPGMGDSWAEINVGFMGTLFNLYQEEGLIHPKQPVWHVDEPVPWIERLRVMLLLPRPQTPRDVARETATLAAFIMELMEHSAPKQGQSSASDWFTQACVLLSNDLSNKVNLSQIASDLGMNYSTFRFKFSQRANVSPMRFRDQRRLQVAHELLANTNKTMAEIANTLGFYDDRHFSTWLKKQVGVSPRVYRQSHLKE